MPKINNTNIYPITGEAEDVPVSAIGTDWKDGGKTVNIPIGGDGGSFLQDNKFRYINLNIIIGLKDDVSTDSKREKVIQQKLAEQVHLMGTLSVSETQLIVFVVNITKVDRITLSQFANSGVITRKYLFPHLMGKGGYDMATFDVSKLELIYESNLIMPVKQVDFEGSTSVIFDIGEVPLNKTITEYLNEVSDIRYPNGYGITDEKKDYFFSWEQDGVKYLQYFDVDNAPNGYGYYGKVGDYLFEVSDFIVLYDENEAQEPVSPFVSYVSPQNLNNAQKVTALRNLGVKATVIDGEIHFYKKHPDNTADGLEFNDIAFNLMKGREFITIAQYKSGDGSSSSDWVAIGNSIEF